MSYKKILVAVDGSKTSEMAFREALHLAKAFKAKIYIVHVIEKLPDHVAYAVDIVKYQMLANKAALSLLDRYTKLSHHKKINSQTQLIEIINYKTSISKKILQTVKKLHIDILVMGTHGRTGFSRFMLGSVAEEVLKTCTVPVFLIRHP